MGGFNSMDIFYSKTEITEERITKLEDRSEENTQIEHRVTERWSVLSECEE